MEEKRLASIKRNEIVWDEIGKVNLDNSVSALIYMLSEKVNYYRLRNFRC